MNKKISIKELPKHKYISLSRADFLQVLTDCKYSDEFVTAFEGNRTVYKEHEEMEDCFMIYIGNIVDNGQLKFPAFNLLIVGNVRANWLNAENPKNYGVGGSLFIVGNVECNYFSNYEGKMSIIDGDLIVDKINVHSFINSGLLIRRNFKSNFFFGLDNWAEVGKKIEINYGIGFCFPYDWEDYEQKVFPVHSETDSYNFLNLDKDSTEEELIEIIEKDYNTM